MLHSRSHVEIALRRIRSIRLAPARRNPNVYAARLLASECTFHLPMSPVDKKIYLQKLVSTLFRILFNNGRRVTYKCMQ